MTALQAHIDRAARLQLALADIERNRICREQSAAQEGADCMLGIAAAVDWCDLLMKDMGVGRVSA